MCISARGVRVWSAERADDEERAEEARFKGSPILRAVPNLRSKANVAKLASRCGGSAAKPSRIRALSEKDVSSMSAQELLGMRRLAKKTRHKAHALSSMWTRCFFKKKLDLQRLGMGEWGRWRQGRRAEEGERCARRSRRRRDACGHHNERVAEGVCLPSTAPACVWVWWADADESWVDVAGTLDGSAMPQSEMVGRRL